jgi:hypothetical protein
MMTIQIPIAVQQFCQAGYETAVVAFTTVGPYTQVLTECVAL